MAGQNPQLPDQTWPITKDDKVQIQDLGRKLNEFLHEHFKAETASTEEVADASPAPSASATPAADAPVDGPTNG